MPLTAARTGGYDARRVPAAARTRRRIATAPRRRKRELPRQLSTSALLTHLAATPSRQARQRPELRADLAENVDRLYQALWRRVHATHNAVIDTTWTQLAAAAGYQDVRTDVGFTSARNYLDLMAEAGLVRYGGVRNEHGQWSRLDIELLEPPTLGSTAPAGVAQSVEATVVCQARRRRETAAQRQARRRRPYRRAGGRRDATPRHALFWHTEVASPSRDRPPVGGPVSLGRAHAHEGRPVGAVAGAAPDGRGWLVGQEERRLLRSSWRHFAELGVPVDELPGDARQLAGLVAAGAGQTDAGLGAGMQAFAVVFGRPGSPPRDRRREQLGRALRRLDRYGGQGQGLRELAGMMVEHGAVGRIEPGGIGFWARELDRRSKQLRRDVKAAG